MYAHFISMAGDLKANDMLNECTKVLMILRCGPRRFQASQGERQPIRTRAKAVFRLALQPLQRSTIVLKKRFQLLQAGAVVVLERT
jgi:hypothetical protein